MDIEKAKEYLYDLEYGLKLEQEENIKKCGYNPEQEIEAIETVLNELDNNDKIINAMANEIYITAIRDDGTHFSTSQEVIDYFTKKVEGK